MFSGKSFSSGSFQVSWISTVLVTVDHRAQDTLGGRLPSTSEMHVGHVTSVTHPPIAFLVVGGQDDASQKVARVEEVDLLRVLMLQVHRHSPSKQWYGKQRYGKQSS